MCYMFTPAYLCCYYFKVVSRFVVSLYVIYVAGVTALLCLLYYFIRLYLLLLLVFVVVMFVCISDTSLSLSLPAADCGCCYCVL